MEGVKNVENVMTAEKTRTLPLPPIVGAIALVGGIALLVVARVKS